MLIDGKFVNSVSGKTFDTINPATESKIASIQEADKADVDIAVKAARKAFDEGPWRKMSGFERGKLMYKFADLLEKHTDELAMLETLDVGKPIVFTKHFEMPYLPNFIRYYAGYADKQHGKTIPMEGPYLAYTRDEPVGVCG